MEGKKKFEVEELLRKEFYKQLQEHNKSQIVRMQETRDHVLKQVEEKLHEVDQRLDENAETDKKQDEKLSDLFDKSNKTLIRCNGLLANFSAR